MEEGSPWPLCTLTAGRSTGIVPAVKDRMPEDPPSPLYLYSTLTAGGLTGIVLVA